MKKYLALFDLDGTLFDTGEVNFLSYQDALHQFGVVLDRDYFIQKCNGRHYTEFIPAIMGGTRYMEQVHERKKELYESYLGAARENTHLFRMIAAMKDTYYTAVVTTASRKNALDILRHFHKEVLFDDLISPEDITKSKPDPEGYVLAMSRFGITAANTLIFEDSPIGISAARASGASVFVVDGF